MADEQEPESEMVKKLRERAAKPLSRVQRRLIEPFSEEDHPLCFQHSVFCQVSLPYRNPATTTGYGNAGRGTLSLRSRPAASFTQAANYRAGRVAMGTEAAPDPGAL